MYGIWYWNKTNESNASFWRADDMYRVYYAYALWLNASERSWRVQRTGGRTKEQRTSAYTGMDIEAINNNDEVVSPKVVDVGEAFSVLDWCDWGHFLLLIGMGRTKSRAHSVFPSYSLQLIRWELCQGVCKLEWWEPRALWRERSMDAGLTELGMEQIRKLLGLDIAADADSERDV